MNEWNNEKNSIIIKILNILIQFTPLNAASASGGDKLMITNGLV